MTLKPGTMLGQYEILDLIGKGGMGEVYRAHDTVLKREVALKVLPPEFAQDRDRVARFRREAQLLASLNHQNIAAIYGLGEDGGQHFLVMELVLGETLADRVVREGPVPVEEVLEIGGQIAEALEAAHEKTIIHRDLKPANVKLTPEGKVKVLDFGLAKAFAAEESDASYSQAPTLSASPTIPGAILGTPAYMSPEQAKGKKVDRRTDIWALGCVLYELLTGKRAFEGETVTEILGAILHKEPDWSLLPADTPAHLRFLLRRCLQRDVKERFHAAPDVRIQIEEAQSAPALAAPVVVAPVPRGLRRLVPLHLAALVAVVAAAVVGIAVWMVTASSRAGGSAVARLTIALPPGEQLAGLASPSVAFSPDGTHLVYIATRTDRSQLYLRAIDGLEAKPLSGTEGASVPFFSPDGQWIGFFAEGKLKKVPVSGGAAITLAEAPNNGRGGTWGPDDTIFFAPNNISGIWRASASGGQPQEVTKLDRSKGEVSHRWPQLLPGGKAVLFTVWTGPGYDEKEIHLYVLATAERRVLVQGGSTGRYVSTGHIVYNRAGTLMAVVFDLARLEVASSPPVPLSEQVVEGSEGAWYGISPSGSLAYVADSPGRQERKLVWVNRSGDVETVPAPPKVYDAPRISPDGRRVAASVRGGVIGTWIYDLSRATLTPLTSGGSSQSPIWTPDGKRVAYRGTRSGFRNLFWRAVDGTGTEERLTTSDSLETPGSFSPDGAFLAFNSLGSATGGDIWVLPLQGDRKPRPWLQAPLAQGNAMFSPDGRWIAYVSSESGRDEVYVQPFPGPGEKSQISTEGGREPLWAGSGKELFYRDGEKMMVVEVSTQPGFSAGRPRLLFEGRYEYSPTGTTGYDVSSDGQRFLMVQATEPEEAPTQIHVVLNWFEELKRRVPAGQ